MVSIGSSALALCVGATGVVVVLVAVALSVSLLRLCNLAVQAAISKRLAIVIVNQEGRDVCVIIKFVFERLDWQRTKDFLGNARFF